MRLVSVIVAVVVLLGLGQSLRAKEATLSHTTVRVISYPFAKPPDTVNGLIYGVRSKSLLIVTVRQVLTNLTYGLRTVQIEFDDGTVVRGPADAYVLPIENLGVITVRSPAEFAWPDGFSGSDLNSNSSVLLLGRYGKFDDYSIGVQASVFELGYEETELESEAMRGGRIGTPAYLNGGVAAVVVRDWGKRVSAVPIKRIQQHVNRLFGIDINQYQFGYPHLLLGIKSGFDQPFLKGNSSEFPASGLIITPTVHDLFVEIGLSKGFALRLERGVSSSILSRNLRVFDDHLQGRNVLKPLSVFLQLYQKISLFSIRNMRSGFYVGYSRVEQKPQLKVNDGPWQDIQEFDQFEHDLETTLNQVWLGLGVSYTLWNTAVLGMDGAFGYSSPGLAMVDPLDPFGEINRKWHMKLQLGVGLLLFNPNAHRDYVR